VKAAGFTTLRIPCAWSGYIENNETFAIQSSWLARVKEVVDYVIGNGM
jgi:endoglucanase